MSEYSYEACARIIPSDIYIFMQWSDSEECWDWTLFDSNMDEMDGGQYDLDADSADEAIRQFCEMDDEFDLSDIDIDDPEQVEFLDADEFREMYF